MRCCLLAVGLTAAVGCSGDTGSGTAGPGASNPITEADVKAAVNDMVNQTQGYYAARAKSVDLLSPLWEPSDQFFQKNPSLDRKNSVACYVLIECEPKAGQAAGARFRSLVVVSGDSGKV